jgi:hypothetical protein
MRLRIIRTGSGMFILLSVFFCCISLEAQESGTLKVDRDFEDKPRFNLKGKRGIEDEHRNTIYLDVLSPVFSAVGFSFERKSSNRKVGWHFPVRVYWFNRRIIQQGEAGTSFGFFPKFYTSDYFKFRSYVGPAVDFGFFLDGVNYFSVMPMLGWLISPHPSWEFSFEGGVGYEIVFDGNSNKSGLGSRFSLLLGYRFGK